MTGIAGEEDPADAEMVGDPVMDAIGREPVDRLLTFILVSRSIASRMLSKVIVSSASCSFGTMPISRSEPSCRTGMMMAKP